MKVWIHDVRKVYSTRHRDVVALAGVSLEVRDREFFALVGPSGCGKTTLLYIIGKLEEPTSGTVEFIGEQKAKALTSMVFQDSALLPWRTVETNIDFPTEIKGEKKPVMKKITGFFVRLVHLNNFEQAYPRQLSGGMKQRASIARAMAHDPEVLLMDEPFAHLDALARRVMQQELIKLLEPSGKTVIYVTHNIEEAVLLSDRIAIMTRSPGRIRGLVEVNLPRPRDTDIFYSPEFRDVVKRVWDLLRRDVEDNIREEEPRPEEKRKSGWPPRNPTDSF